MKTFAFADDRQKEIIPFHEQRHGFHFLLYIYGKWHLAKRCRCSSDECFIANLRHDGKRSLSRQVHPNSNVPVFPLSVPDGIALLQSGVPEQECGRLTRPDRGRTSPDPSTSW